MKCYWSKKCLKCVLSCGINNLSGNMSPPKIKPEVRDRIRHFLNAGHCITMVIKACKSEGLTVSHATVQKVRNGGYESRGTAEVKSIRGRPLSVMTKSKSNLLQKMTSDSNPITQRSWRCLKGISTIISIKHWEWRQERRSKYMHCLNGTLRWDESGHCHYIGSCAMEDGKST